MRSKRSSSRITHFGGRDKRLKMRERQEVVVVVYSLASGVLVAS